MIRYQLLLVASCLWFWGTSPASSQTLLQEVRSGNGASQANIRALQCRVEVKRTYNPDGPVPAAKGVKSNFTIYNYTRAGEKERLIEVGGSDSYQRDAVRDFATDNCSVFTPKIGNTVPSAGLASIQMSPILAQPWEWVGFQLPWGERALYQLLAETQADAVVVKQVPNSTLIHLDIRATEEHRYEAWVDSRVGYLIRKYVWHRKLGTGVQLVGEILAYRECKPGVYFPEKTISTLVYEGTWIRKDEAEYQNIQVNPTVPGNKFQHKFPPGTRVMDYHKNLTYTVGSDGNPGKKSTVHHPLAPQPEATQPLTATPLEADNPSWPWRRVLLVVSAVAVVVGSLLLFRKRRQRVA